MSADVRVAAHHHRKVAVEAVHLADATRPVELEPELTVAFAHDHRPRPERFEMLGERYRAASRSTTAMRGGEGLVHVDVENIRAEIAGPRLPQNRVQVGTIAIDQTAGIMNDRRNLVDPLLEQSQGIRVRQHQGRGVLAGSRAKSLDVDRTL